MHRRRLSRRRVPFFLHFCLRLHRTSSRCRKLATAVVLASLVASCVFVIVKFNTDTDELHLVELVSGARLAGRYQLHSATAVGQLDVEGTSCSDDEIAVPPEQIRLHRKWCDSTTETGNSGSDPWCLPITCSALLHGDVEAQRLAANVTSGSDRRLTAAPKDVDLVNATANCATYRSSQDFRDVVDPSSADFPIAFNLIVHRDAHQVARLLRAIYRPNNVYCIHVDTKSPANFRSAISALAQCFDNVHLASRLEKITWAGYSRLQADINCMEDHVTGGKDWKYLINTAGQAFPLRTVEEMVRILRLYNGANDIEGIFGRRVLRFRFEYEWLENAATRGGMRRTGRKNPPPPHNIDIVRGSAYGVFSRAFVEFVLRDQRARDLLEWSQRTWSPDELYWASLHHTYANPHLHTPGAYLGFPNSKPWLAVYVNWGEMRCFGRRVRGVCVFGVGDLPALTSRKEFFANKFYSDYQPLTLDCLEAWLKHKEACPPSDDLDYYRQLPFINQP